MKLDWRTKYIFIRIFPQVVQLLWVMILLCNSTTSQYVKTEYNHSKPYVLLPVVETLPKDENCSQRFNQTRDSIPHTVDPKDVALFETSDEEIDDTGISDETTTKIRELSLACKEFELKVSKYLKQTGHQDIHYTHPL